VDCDCGLQNDLIRKSATKFWVAGGLFRPFPFPSWEFTIRWPGEPAIHNPQSAISVVALTFFFVAEKIRALTNPKIHKRRIFPN
jgi:hypothetical protein